MPKPPTKKTEIKLSKVMDYIKGEELNPDTLDHYSTLLRNFKDNFSGFIAMTAYKQMSRLGRLLDQLEAIEERLYMDPDSAPRDTSVRNGQYDEATQRLAKGSIEIGENGIEKSGEGGIKGVSESNEERLLAMAQRISAQVQNTLSFLMALLDRIEQKNLPDKLDMIRANKALPEGSSKSTRLTSQQRRNVREMVNVLQDQLEDDSSNS